MLVLSRRLNEKVLFPNLGISIEILKVNKDRVRLGIEAPESIQVLRSEIAPPPSEQPSPRSVLDMSQLLADFRKQLKQMVDRLYELHDNLLERDADQEAEALVYGVFIELKTMDDMVARFIEMGLGSPVIAQPKRRALIVEDNLNEARLLAGFLKARNFDVQIAGNGKVAIDYLDAHESPDCMLLDMAMPQFDGEWTLRELRNKSGLEDLKIFVMSGAEPSDYEIALGPRNQSHWFRKPLDPEILVQKIEMESYGRPGPLSA
ncbi:MAG: hypothetical protein CMJ46_02525 [Planctomyces sp.]|nr:hypothetical protein [Planctomyces sp.]